MVTRNNRQKKYKLTAEHAAMLPEWRDKWIANAMSTAAMSAQDRDICRDAVRRLYRAANLTPPPDRRIVFVPSPVVARYAGGFAAWIWHTRQATDQATYQATDQATYQATAQATGQATDQATRQATDQATDSTSWYRAPAIGPIASALGVGYPGIICAQKAYAMWQGGNQWSGFDSYLSFFRHVAKLPIDYSAWDAWETLSLHSGPRVVHREFCIISDRPEILTVDDQNRPHAEHGPFCKWRDGTALYAWHGVYVPAIWIEDRSSLTAAAALSIENMEQRRAACEIVGWDRILSELNAVTIHTDPDPMIGELVEVSLPDAGRERFLRVVCGTGRRFAIPVPPTVQTALEANAWTYGLDASDYNPEYRT